MSSRTSSGQRRVFPNKKQEINWDVLGFSSAAITLLGAGTLYIIGWAYVSNWYQYFGINIEQIDLPLQQILIFSTPAILSVIILVPLSVSYYFFIFFIRRFFNASLETLSKNDWWGVLVFYIFFMFLSSLMSYYELFGGYKEIFLFQLPTESSFFALTVMSVFTIVLGAALLFTFIPFLFFRIPFQILSQVVSIIVPHGKIADILKKIRVPKPLNPIILFSGIKRSIWLGAVGFIYFLSLLSASAASGYADAAAGKRGISGDVQKVYLVSPQSLSFMRENEQSCDHKGICTYGPFGLLIENDTSFYLVKWNDNNSEKIKFPKNPGVYIIPRNDQKGSYFIIPIFTTADPLNISTHTPCSCVTDTPTPTYTALPTITQTASPTITVTPIPTAIQP